jgi:putative glutamine amidotransferase
MKPRIAIPVPTTADHDYNQRSWPQYAEAVRRSGGEPVSVELTLSSGDLRELMATIHGVCLPGSPADVNPVRFGAERDPATAPADPAREAIDNALLEDAIHHGKPVLGICFGVQSMNAWRGGSLVQDLTPVPVNHSAGREVAIAHTVLISKESELASLVDRSEAVTPSAAGVLAEQFLRLPVNTSHHQSVAAPGHSLRIVARCPDDGVVEAVELDPTVSGVFHVEHSAGRSNFLLGVQWHPERSYEISATSRNLFAHLVSEAGRVKL